ncbi:hypothetical protein LEP1GSC132_0627 [Leptospira kirschneri str. 200803703]|uniref:Uncharacterized protein n=1 Tax=Leptospira kirschneri str. 200802841 TaxID=1193047 RepID=A0A828YBC5_9LEPT|nr:hypothetical protein LEP1GSC131_3197 [Leptospira kirschneri str. 200802841]EMN26199.1 hypothetical protein LEP1GSC065_2270 [Leptospira kirschneri serovar Sokoine str. RM1]EMO66159.1 hypothetical protein LEP1GSC132_0627 [Leptospira kirschneri str. 200803703]
MCSSQILFFTAITSFRKSSYIHFFTVKRNFRKRIPYVELTLN